MTSGARSRSTSPASSLSRRRCFALLQARRGRIVFISSIGGRDRAALQGAYHAAKCGIEAVGDVLRQELRPWGIAVSLVEPGSVATPIWDKGEAEATAGGANAPLLRTTCMASSSRRFAGAVRRTAERGNRAGAGGEAGAPRAHRETPRTRYLVGRDAVLQARMRPLLGARVFDRLVAREMNR
jgi:NAD(P)-dependent dehydrogenase (short-subunit alcohol dehydrogenase family)